MTNIHDTAIISANVKIGDNVSIGPYCNIDGDITINDNVTLISHISISGDWLNRVIRDNYKGIVLGPVYPEISRIKNKYHKQFLIKLRNLDELNRFRSIFQKIQKSFDSISKYRSVRIIVDVDPI